MPPRRREEAVEEEEEAPSEHSSVSSNGRPHGAPAQDRSCSNCHGRYKVLNKQGEYVTHNKGNCPKLVAAQANASRSAQHSERGHRRAGLQVDLEGVAGSLRPTVSGCVEALSSVDVSTGSTLEGRTLGELCVLLTGRDVTFAGFRAEVMRRICDDDLDATAIQKHLAILQSAAVGQKPDTQSEVLAGAGMPKVGALEKILDALIRRAKSESKFQTCRGQGGDQTVKVDEHGRQYYEVQGGGEQIGRLTTFVLILEQFRHVMVALGEGTEHSMQHFTEWHLKRLDYGEPLAVVVLTCRMLIRNMDGEMSDDWIGAINFHAHHVLADARAALGTDIFRVAAEQEVQAPAASGKVPCQNWNREDPAKAGQSKGCAYTDPKTGKCKYLHVCSGCEGPEPKWKCGC
jgi:hypothetical protein